MTLWGRLSVFVEMWTWAICTERTEMLIKM